MTATETNQQSAPVLQVRNLPGGWVVCLGERTLTEPDHYAAALYWLAELEKQNLTLH